MYQPKLGRFMSRDPLPQNGVEIFYPVPDMRKYYQRSTYQHLYVYVVNNPANFVDPSGLQEQPSEPDPCTLTTFPNPCMGSKSQFTKVSVCVKKVDPAGGHVYINIDCGGGPLKRGVWTFRGGPDSMVCPQCKDKCMGKQLRGGFYEFSPDAMPPNPDYPRDPNEGLTHICNHYTLAIAPDKLAKCMQDLLVRIRDCCIPYEALAVGDPNKGCNSNCVAWWLVNKCFGVDIDAKKIELPEDLPKPVPGWQKEYPDCLKPSAE